MQKANFFVKKYFIYIRELLREYEDIIMTTLSTANWAMPNYSYGKNTFNLPINSYVSPMPNSAFGCGFAPIGTGSSSETYEQIARSIC